MLLAPFWFPEQDIDIIYKINIFKIVPSSLVLGNNLFLCICFLLIKNSIFKSDFILDVGNLFN